jgi:hypothetical protein
MGLFTRLKTGWSLAKDSLGVLRREPSLAAFPAVAGVSGLLFLVVLNGGLYLTAGIESEPVAYAALFGSYFGTTFLSSFFTAALMHNARAVFRGEDPAVADGLRAALANAGTILAWAALAATVGVVLRAVETSDNVLARVLAGLFSVAWGILTYFVVPVIVFEDVGLVDSVRRSGETFRETWGETAGAGFGVGLMSAVFVLAGLAVAAVVFVAALSLGGSLAALAVAGLVAVVLVLTAVLFGQALGGVARTALYVYATEDRKPDGFEDVDFSTTVR